ncbi:NAD-dependent epimerase/dehydratase family protein [Candidatus Saccharibacteria bacterium]|nr:NAD-dependent epimerase/dehydratase family protein [Candidatus Saccharibacteria bacterium]
MKYLLLGGSGFIGSHLAKKLSKDNFVAVAGRNKKDNSTSFYYHEVDFTNCKDFSNLIAEYDVIIHLVSTILPSENLQNINQEITDNVFPSVILLKNIIDLNKQLVFISSGGTVYGDSNKPKAETDNTNPICNYGISKLFIEKYINLYNYYYSKKFKIIRLANPYSEETFRGRKQGIIPIIIDNTLSGKETEIYGKNQTRDYIYIDDAISGILSVLDYRGNQTIFNIGTGIGHTIEQIISLIEDKLGKKCKISYSSPRKCDVQNNVLDISLIKNETNWHPKTSLSQGIDTILEKIQGRI